jgi:hypothetical protein
MAYPLPLKKLFNMQSTPNKPEVFAGWQHVFPPINLNFANFILPDGKNPTIFIGYYKTICRQARKLLSSSFLPINTVALAVCPRAYFKPYHHFWLLPVYSGPSIFAHL